MHGVESTKADSRHKTARVNTLGLGQLSSVPFPLSDGAARPACRSFQK